jgi:hypothetical protein
MAPVFARIPPDDRRVRPFTGGVIGFGRGIEQKFAWPMTGPVMVPFENCFGRAVTPLNQTVKMQSACFTARFPFGNHE